MKLQRLNTACQNRDQAIPFSALSGSVPWNVDRVVFFGFLQHCLFTSRFQNLVFLCYISPIVFSLMVYHVNFLNIRTPKKICSNHSKIWTMWLYNRVMSPNDADGMANSVDPDQTAPRLIWICTVCPGISVRKLRIITVSLLLPVCLFVCLAVTF